MLADCPDCGRMELLNYRCSKCGGASWRPAGVMPRQIASRMPWLAKIRLVKPIAGAVARCFGKRAGGK